MTSMLEESSPGCVHVLRDRCDDDLQNVCVALSWYSKQKQAISLQSISGDDSFTSKPDKCTAKMYSFVQYLHDKVGIKFPIAPLKYVAPIPCRYYF